jgi:hypothetical protein
LLHRCSEVPHDSCSCGLGQSNYAIRQDSIKLFPGRMPCAAHAPPVPCTFRRSARKS